LQTEERRVSEDISGPRFDVHDVSLVFSSELHDPVEAGHDSTGHGGYLRQSGGENLLWQHFDLHRDLSSMYSSQHGGQNMCFQFRLWLLECNS